MLSGANVLTVGEISSSDSSASADYVEESSPMELGLPFKDCRDSEPSTDGCGPLGLALPVW